MWLPTTISGVPRRAVIHLNKISSRQGVRAGVDGGWERARTREQDWSEGVCVSCQGAEVGLL